MNYFTISTTPPNVTLVSPADSFNTTNLTINFTCNATDQISLSNISLYLWNSTGSLVHTNSTNVTGLTNQSSWTYTFASLGNYSWNCLAYDVANNLGYQPSNDTLTIQRFVAINVTSPLNGTILPRGNESTPNENRLNDVSTNVTMTANVYDNLSMAGLNGVDCLFYFDNVMVGNALTNSSGYCSLSYDKSSQSFGMHNITVNYSALPAYYVSAINSSTSQIDLENWTIPIVVSNTPYHPYGVAGVYVNITRNGVLSDPTNMTMIMTDTGGFPLNTVYLQNFTRLSAGSYYAELIIPDVDLIMWKGYASYDFGQGEINVTSNIHGDIAINPNDAILNLSLINGSGSALSGSENIYEYGILNSYLLNSTTTTTAQPVVLGANYTVLLNYTNYSVDVYHLNVSNPDVNITTQIAPAHSLPSYIANSSQAIASNASNFTIATLVFPRTIDPGYICLCANWNFSMGDCAASWQCNSTSDYDFAENSTNFWFNVTSFSGYVGGAGYDDNLTIWDSNDTQGGSQVIYQGQQAYFYANFTNETSGQSINSANCNITFNLSGGWTAPANMAFNASSLVYQYNTSFLQNGTINWSATCSGTGYDIMTANDSIQIAFAPPPAVSLVTPANNVSISSASQNFTFNETNAFATVNCSLFIDGASNQTNASVANNTNTNFSISGLPQGDHNWSVQCTDVAGKTNMSATRNFTIDTLGPNVTWYNQTPADIDTYNAIANGVDITYNITDPSGVDPASPILYYKTNTSTSDCWTYVNGSYESCGYQKLGPTSNATSLWLWELEDDQIYPATYNLNEHALEDTPHNSTALTSPETEIKIQLLNVSNSSQYGVFELMANATNGTAPLDVYYCNSSYTSGDINSTFCTEFGTISPTQPYNNTETIYSSHMVMPFSINTTTGFVGAVEVTSTSYFVLRPASGGGAWAVYYIPNVSRTSAIQSSSDNGSSWSNFAGTVDSHLHQYDGTNTVWYYACANDTLGNNNCSDARYDLLNLAGIPPTSPSVYSPTSKTYNSIIVINYTASMSPNGYPISYYNISLLNSDFSFNNTIIGNNSINLSYVWDPAGTRSGNYSIRVQACDNLSQCSYGYSAIFTLDTIPPNIIQNSPADDYLTNASTINFNFTATDDLSNTLNCSLYVDDVINQTNASTLNGTATLFPLYSISDGIRNWSISCIDQAGNMNVSATRNFTVDTVAPLITLNSPANLSIFNVSSVVFNFTAVDNLSSSMNCSIFLDGILNQTNASTINNTASFFTIASIPDGFHYWSIQCTDSASNTGISASKNFTINIHAPVIALTAPTNLSIFNVSSVNFNFTAVDNLSSTMNCSIYLDGVLNQTNSATANNTPTIFTISGIPDGYHPWSVECADNADNVGTSVASNVAVDTIPPYFTYIANITMANGNALGIQFTAVDNTSGVSAWSVNDTGFAINNSGYLTNASVLGVGVHYLNISVDDFAGNTVSTAIYINVTLLPVINSFFVTPMVISGSNVTLFINASNADSQWANITRPDGNSSIINLTNDANATYTNTTLAGIYNVTFQANNSVGIATNRTHFEATPLVIFNVTVTDANLSGLNSTLSVYFGNTTLAINSSQNGSYSIGVPDALLDFGFTAFGNQLQALLRGINASASNNLSFGMDLLPTPVTGYLATYAIDNKYDFTNATLSVSYNGTDYTNENYLRLYRCDPWNFTARLCYGNWTDVTANASLNTTTRYFTYLTSNFSAFSIKQGAYCGDGSCNAGETCSSCPADCGVCHGGGGGGGGGGSGGSSQGGGGSGNVFYQENITLPHIPVVPPLPCGSDGDCPSAFACIGGQCMALSGVCGQAVNHTWEYFQCCADSECPSTQSCSIPPGAKGGACQNITGCGVAVNHTLIPYQCGSDPNCPSCASGLLCIDNSCKSFELKGPASGFIGEIASIQALEDNATCAGCDLRISYPTGKVAISKTDASGNFILPLYQAGNYEVDYMMNATVVGNLSIISILYGVPIVDNPLFRSAGFVWLILLGCLIAVIILIYRREKGYWKGSFKGRIG